MVQPFAATAQASARASCELLLRTSTLPWLISIVQYVLQVISVEDNEAGRSVPEARTRVVCYEVIHSPSCIYQAVNVTTEVRGCKLGIASPSRNEYAWYVHMIPCRTSKVA